MNTDEKLKKLHELRELLDNGTLTQEEFEKLKATMVRELAQNEPVADKKRTEIPPEENVSNNPTQSKKRIFQNETTSDYESKKSSGKEKFKAKKPFYKRVWFIILIIFIVFVCIVLFTPGSDSTSNSKNSPSNVELSEDKAESSNIKSEEQTTETPVITSISAKYEGSTSAGTVLNSDNPDIIVTANYDDGSTCPIEYWSIEKAKTLKAQKNTTVVISYRNLSCKLKVFCTSKVKKTAKEKKADFKKSCQEIAYKKIARNPDNYIAKKIKISGKVIQVMEDNDNLTLRVATKDGYDDVFLVAYTYSDKDSKVLEDDFITIWGYCQGTVTYESTLGGNITIPAMSAKYLKISE